MQNIAHYSWSVRYRWYMTGEIKLKTLTIAPRPVVNDHDTSFGSAIRLYLVTTPRAAFPSDAKAVRRSGAPIW
jgi:hypothetical protein